MILKIIKSTDGKLIGQTVEVPSSRLGELPKPIVKAMARSLYGLTPDKIIYSGNQVRLVNSNYSVTLEVI
jgi:hypothetical protein